LEDGPLPSTIREINQLPKPNKRRIYRDLLPPWLSEEYDLDLDTLTVDGEEVVWLRCPAGSRALELSVKRNPQDRDPVYYAHITDTFNNQLLVLMVIVNDPDAPRFNIDIDKHGNPTHYGTVGRNIPAETAALEYGLAPGQVRPGLRVFRKLVPLFEAFVRRMSQSMFFIEPLAYHNALVFERYGFSYVRGLAEMNAIHAEFQPGGVYHQRLDGRSIFRPEGAWKSVRGRSWAIHDGILGHPFTGFQMFKRLGHHAEICTAPGLDW